MKITTKTFVLSLAMAGMLLPMAAYAQSDGFFRDGGDYTNRDGNGAYSLNNQTFGQEAVPLGSGLIVMLAAGVGYAVMRRKR